MAIYVNTYALNEGEQAEEYKRKKKEAEIESKRQDIKMIHNRSYAGYGAGENKNPNHVTTNLKGVVKASLGKTNDKNFDKNYDRSDDAYKAVKKHASDTGRPISGANLIRAYDATNRHMRKHPDAYKEMGIFAECEFISLLEDSVITSMAYDSDETKMKVNQIKQKVDSIVKDELKKFWDETKNHTSTTDSQFKQVTKKPYHAQATIDGDELNIVIQYANDNIKFLDYHTLVIDIMFKNDRFIDVYTTMQG